jgi:hypothetical protein
MKTGLLESRPLFLRCADHTSGHVFMVMLSYLLTQKIAKSTADLEMTTAELMYDLDLICLQYQWQAEDVRISRLPKPAAAPPAPAIFHLLWCLGGNDRWYDKSPPGS